MIELTIGWEIGKEAKEIDEKPIAERIRVPKRTIKRMFGALCIYFITMALFYFFL